MNLDTITLTVTAPGAGGTAMTAVSGDSLQIRNGSASSRILGVAMWTKAQLLGVTQLTWPSGHDLIRGFRYRNLANQTDNKVPLGSALRFRAQDPLTVLEIGSVTAGDVELVTMLMFYGDLPGVSARLVNMHTIRSRGVTSLTVEDTITPTAASVYSGARAINAASDQLQANTDYAILGAQVGAVCGAVTVRGVDTGNLRVAIPGLSVDANWTGNWFGMLSDALDLPLVPVFNSANRAGIFIEITQDENLTAVPLSLQLVELAPVGGPT